MYPIYGAVRRLGGYSVWQFYNWKIDDQQWDVERPYLAQKPILFGRSFRWDIHIVGHETKGNMMINHVGFWGIYNFYLYYIYMHTYTSHYIYMYCTHDIHMLLNTHSLISPQKLSWGINSSSSNFAQVMAQGVKM